MFVGMKAKKEQKYPMLQLRDNKEKTWHTKVYEIIDYYKESNPDNLEDWELKNVNIPYVLKKAINKMHKECCHE